LISEEILEAIKNKKTAFYNWKTNERIKDILVGKENYNI
jgi:hypothetical protein